MRISYREIAQWKYRLTPHCGRVVIPTSIRVPNGLHSSYVSLLPNGRLIIESGYAWDGPSGPTFDTPSFMRGSLVHDALYQLMGEGKLSWSYQKTADQLLRQLCREDGMGWLRTQYVYLAVRWFGRQSSMASRNKQSKLHWAP